MERETVSRNKERRGGYIEPTCAKAGCGNNDPEYDGEYVVATQQRQCRVWSPSGFSRVGRHMSSTIESL